MIVSFTECFDPMPPPPADPIATVLELNRARYTFENLERYLWINHGPDPEIVSGAGDPLRDGRILTNAFIGRYCHTDRYTVHRWRQAGALTIVQVDNVTAGLGIHPQGIWPNYYDDLLVDEEEQCA